MKLLIFAITDISRLELNLLYGDQLMDQNLILCWIPSLCKL